jgi:hypothetical protein
LTINWESSLERFRVLVCSNIKATINVDEASSRYISLECNAPAEVGNSSTIILSTNDWHCRESFISFLSISIQHVCCHESINTVTNDWHCRKLFVSVLLISIRQFCCHESIDTLTNNWHCRKLFVSVLSISIRHLSKFLMNKWHCRIFFCLGLG